MWLDRGGGCYLWREPLESHIRCGVGQDHFTVDLRTVLECDATGAPVVSHQNVLHFLADGRNPIRWK